MIPELYGEYRPGAVSGGKWGATGRQAPMSVQIARPHTVDPAFSWNWFNPRRHGVRLADAGFRAQLHEIDPRLEVCWHPLRERWVCFFKQPDITFWMCPGWKRLFIVQYPDGAYMPLDERTFGEAWSRNPKLYNYSGRQFFDRVVLESMRDAERTKLREHEGFVEAVARDRWRFAQIKNIGQGNKYTNHVAAD